MARQDESGLWKEGTAQTHATKKLEEKEAQHTALEVALKEYGYDVTVLPIILDLVQFTRQQNMT